MVGIAGWGRGMVKGKVKVVKGEVGGGRKVGGLRESKAEGLVMSWVQS